MGAKERLHCRFCLRVDHFCAGTLRRSSSKKLKIKITSLIGGDWLAAKALSTPKRLPSGYQWQCVLKTALVEVANARRRARGT